MTGIAVGAYRIFNPFLILGASLTTTASGLLMTLQPDSSHAAWVGYQALAGVGLGLCFNVHIIIVQNIVKPDEIATATAILLCTFWALLIAPNLKCQLLTIDVYVVFQSLGGALVVSAGQSLFQNELIDTLPRTSPAVSPTDLFEIGASEIQTTFSASELPGIDAAYMQGFHMAFALAIAMAGAATIVTCGQNWFRLQGTNKNTVTENSTSKEKDK